MSDAQRQGPVTRPNGRGLRIALAVSAALNLAIVGVIAGAVLNGNGPGARSPLVRDLGFGVFTEALTPADRAELRLRFLKQAPGLRQDRQAMRKDLETLLTALRTDPFDAAAFDAALQAQGNRMTDRLRVGQSLVRDYLTDMSPDQRRAFADRLEAAASRRGPKPTSSD